MIGLVALSCTKTVLDKQPLNIISGDQVFKDPNLISAYVTQVYSELTFLFNDATNDRTSYESPGSPELSFDINLVGEMSDESRCTYTWLYTWYRFKPEAYQLPDGGLLEWWGYPTIRKMNVFLESIPTASISDAQKKSYTAEMRFLRALSYFEMVKRYGGVPIITKAQSTSDSTLAVPRNKEMEVYDFINSELDASIPDLPADNSSIPTGHPTKYAALALKSRSSLYAASIANYGTVQLNGLVGIPASEKTRFYQSSYDAAKAIIDGGRYSLYNKVPTNKSQNFQNIFLDEGNNEVIFSKEYNGTAAVGHGWDCFQSPFGYNAWGVGQNSSPYLDMVNEFENVDGSPRALDPSVYSTGLWTINDLFGKKDPRFEASIYHEGTPWQGGVFHFYRALQLPDNSVISSGSFNGVSAQGGQFGSNSTGFGTKKYLDEKLVQPAPGQSSTDWIVFRYAEVLLNQAEAAIELGQPSVALTDVNLIRSRAGVPTLSSVDRDGVRHERKVELFSEGHRFWDLRRWRIAASAISKPSTGLSLVLDYTTRKYKVEFVPNIDGNSPPKFVSPMYYFPITRARISNDPALAPENPGY